MGFFSGESYKKDFFRGRATKSGFSGESYKNDFFRGRATKTGFFGGVGYKTENCYVIIFDAFY